MFDYTGHSCKSCGEKFKENDDIVVCPECGTPYHRDCYKKEGKCINAELHESGGSWKADAMESAAAVKCRNCGSPLKADQLFCDRCGTPTDYYNNSQDNPQPYVQNGYKYVSPDNEATGRSSSGLETLYPNMINYSDPLCGLNPTESFEENVTAKDLGDYVKSNTRFYMPKFQFFKLTPLKTSINVASLFFPELYFAYRKMSLAAFGILLLRTITSIPSIIVTMQMPQFASMAAMYPEISVISDAIARIAEYNTQSTAFQTVSLICSMINWGIVIVFGLFANYFYYKSAVKKITSVKASMPEVSPANLANELNAVGGTSPIALFVFVLLYFAMQYGAMAAVMFLL